MVPCRRFVASLTGKSNLSQSSCRRPFRFLAPLLIGLVIGAALPAAGQTPQPSKEYIRLGGRVVAIENAPAGPTGLTATAGSGVVVLSWTASSDATSYAVYRGAAAGSETFLANTPDAPYTDSSSLTVGSTYYYKVAAVNGNGTSPLSIEVSAKVTQSAPVSVSVSPVSSTLYGGNTQQFAATVANSPTQTVTWAQPTVGSISSSGLYTAPSSITTQQAVTVTATSTADTTKSGSATVTLMPPIAVSVSPTSASLCAGYTQQFTATVANTTNQAVNWTISPSLGSVSASGLYTAPASFTQTVNVTATSVADSTKSASATVTPTTTNCTGQQPISINTSSISLDPILQGSGGSVTVTSSGPWTAASDSSAWLTFTYTTHNGGSSSPEVLNFAVLNNYATTSRTGHITFTPTSSGSSVVFTVTQAGISSFTVYPPTVTASPGQQLQFGALINGVLVPTFNPNWSYSPVDNNGQVEEPYFIYTAPSGTGTVTITATVPNTQISASATVQLTPAPPSGPTVTVTPTNGSGTGAQFTVQVSNSSSGPTEQVDFIVGSSATAYANSCVLSLVAQLNGSTIVPNEADATLWGNSGLTTYQDGIIPIYPVPGFLYNSQCSLNVGASSASWSSTAGIVLNLDVTFTGGYSGLKNVYAEGITQVAAGTATTTYGVTTTSNGSPSVVSVSPVTSGGMGQTFAAVYSDPNGAANLVDMELQINSSQSGTGACQVRYLAGTNSFSLLSDDGSTWGSPYAPGSSNSASNSQCQLNLAGASVANSGNSVTLNVPLVFSAGFVGAKVVYLYAADQSGATAGWTAMGNYTVSPVTVTIAPTTAALHANQTLQFAPTVNNSGNSTVTWTVAPGSGWSGAIGTISSSGLYQTTSTVTAQHTEIVTATSVGSPWASATATVTLLMPGQDLTIAMSPAGSFTQGQIGAAYAITVSNSGTTATSGTVTVVDTLPASLTATAMSGTGWSCTLSALTCTRSDALPTGSSYPALALTVNVAINAPSSVIDTATVSGGGDTYSGNDTATVVSPVAQASPTSTTAANASATYSASSQSVALLATIASPAGVVNGGTVTFTLLQGTTQVGTPAVSGTVINGSAAASYTLPAATATGNYTIQASYSGGAGFAPSTSAPYVWVADTANNRLQEFSLGGRWQATIPSGCAGSSSPACPASVNNGQFAGPSFVAVDSSGNVWVTEPNNSRVQKFNSSGVWQLTIPSGCTNSSVPACTPGSGNGQFGGPEGIAIDSSNNVWVADENDRLQKFNSSGVYLSEIGSVGWNDGQFGEAVGVAVDSAGNIWGSDLEYTRVEKFNSSGVWQLTIPHSGCGIGGCPYGPANGEFQFNFGIAADSSGNIWVTDEMNNRVQKFSGSGTWQMTLPTSGCGSSTPACPTGSGNGQFDYFIGNVVVDPSGNILVPDSGNHRVQTFNSSGVYQSQFGSSGAGIGQFYGLEGIAITAGTAGTLTIALPAPPPAPTGLAATAGNAQVVLSWMASSGVTSYSLYRATTSGGEGTTALVTGITASTYTDSAVTNGAKYYYTVAAVNAGGTGAQSTEVSATPVNAPPTPTGLTASPGNAQVSLTWTASSGATSYNLYRASTSGGEGATPLMTGIATTTFTDIAVTNGAKYYYTVAAVNAGGTSAQSTEVSATPVAPPPTPTGLTATPGNAQVSLSWSASSGASSYNVYRATTSGGEGSTAYATGIATTTYTNTGLTNGTAYYYTVAAVNAGGTSAPSTEVSATTMPPAPTGLTATPGNAQVSLSWSASSGATTYNVYRATTSGGEGSTAYATGITTTTYTNTGLTSGTKYFYTVAAVNAGGTSAQSSEVSATTMPPTPTGLSATSGNAQVVLSWSASSGATTYNVYRATTSGGEGATAYATGITTTTYTDSAANNGTPYYYKVAAVNAGGTSAQSTEVSATPQAPAATTTTTANTSVTYSASSQAVAVRATVTSPAGAVNGGTVTFTLLQGATQVGTPVVSGTVSNGSASASYTVPGATASGNYTIQAAYSGSSGFAASTSAPYVWVVDSGNNRVQKLSLGGIWQATIPSGCTGACSASGGNGRFNGPQFAAVDSSGNLWVADTGNNRVQEFNSSGVWQLTIPSGCTGSSPACAAGSGNGQFYWPEGIAIDPAGNIWVADYSNNRVQEFNSSGVYQSTLGSEGGGNGQFSYPMGIAADPSGNIWVADSGNNRVEEFNSSGVWKDTLGWDCTIKSPPVCVDGPAIGQFSYYVAGMTADSSGNVWISDDGNNRVVSLNSYVDWGMTIPTSGCSTTSYPACPGGSGNGQFMVVGNVVVDASGNILVPDRYNNRVQTFNSSGVYQSQFGSGGNGNGQFYIPAGMAMGGGMLTIH